MRLLRGLLLSTALVSSASAADYLRGPAPEPAYAAAQQRASFDWSGFYVGGAFAHTSAKADYSRIGPSVAENAFPTTIGTTEIGTLIGFPNKTVRKSGFSGFAGYNTMWDDVVLGLEVEYNRANVDASSSTIPLARQIGVGWDVFINGGQARQTLKDYGVARMRIGVAYDRFMPFVSFGVVAANAVTTTSLNAVAFDRATTPPGRLDSISSTFKSEGHAWGYALGFGVDAAVTDNLFLRGQWEHVNIGGNANPSLSMNVFKAGAGVKF